MFRVHCMIVLWGFPQLLPIRVSRQRCLGDWFSVMHASQNGADAAGCVGLPAATRQVYAVVLSGGEDQHTDEVRMVRSKGDCQYVVWCFAHVLTACAASQYRRCCKKHQVPPCVCFAERACVDAESVRLIGKRGMIAQSVSAPERRAPTCDGQGAES